MQNRSRISRTWSRQSFRGFASDSSAAPSEGSCNRTESGSTSPARRCSPRREACPPSFSPFRSPSGNWLPASTSAWRLHRRPSSLWPRCPRSCWPLGWLAFRPRTGKCEPENLIRHSHIWRIRFRCRKRQLCAPDYPYCCSSFQTQNCQKDRRKLKLL